MCCSQHTHTQQRPVRILKKNGLPYLLSVRFVLHQVHLPVATFAHGPDEGVVIHHSSTLLRGSPLHAATSRHTLPTARVNRFNVASSFCDGGEEKPIQFWVGKLCPRVGKKISDAQEIRGSRQCSSLGNCLGEKNPTSAERRPQRDQKRCSVDGTAPPSVCMDATTRQILIQNHLRSFF